jgi:hypothetical protein
MCCKFASHLGFPRIHPFPPRLVVRRRRRSPTRPDPSRRRRAPTDPKRSSAHVVAAPTDRPSTTTGATPSTERGERNTCPRRARAPTTARPRPRRRRHSFVSPRASCRAASSSTSTRLGARFLVACARDSTSGRGERRRRVRASRLARARDVRDADGTWKRCDGSFVHEASVMRFFDATRLDWMTNRPTD